MPIPNARTAMRGYPRNRLTDHTNAAPVNTKTAQSRGYAISYEDAGTGPTVVLLPGWTMSAGDWRDAGYVDRLATSHRVLNVDPLGNGLSDKPHEAAAYRHRDVAADVVAVLVAEGISKAVVWGYSRGAYLALAMGTEFPARLAGIILAGGGDLTEEITTGSEPEPLDVAMWNGDFDALWDTFSFSQEDRQYDAEVNDPRALGAMGLAATEFGTSADCSRVAVPALVYCGGEDRPAGNRKTADALRAEFRVLPGLDHLTSFSDVDFVMPMVLEFLESAGI
jgi:pimeloyl-ACP methyl ester carboxylesterase